MKCRLVILLLGCSIAASAQDSVHQLSPLSTRHKKTRIYTVAAGHLAAYGSTLAVLSNNWYSNYSHSRFHFFDDSKDWLQMDKAGHLFSAYTTGKISAAFWQWTGLSRKQSIWIGGLSGTAFMTTIEVLDGFSAEWGFSVSDMAANLAGSSLFIGQELAWNEQRVQVKYSFHRRDYGSPLLNDRANALFGRSALERTLKDYNAQTYWLSANIRSFFKGSNLPPWLNIAVGYGADGMFGGTENVSKDANGAILFDQRGIARYRQWYLAPDIDLTRIKSKSGFLRTALFLLNAFKFPTPSIGLSKKGIEWNWIHF